MGAVKEHYHDEIEAGMHDQTESQPKNKHKIQWLNLPGYKGESWNPIAGCTKISEGCENCYAEKMAVRLAAMAIKHVKPMSVGKYVKVIRGRQWDGTTYLNEEELLIPLLWKQPRVVFVCSMGDLFHENVPFLWIDRVMAIAALKPQHIFILLTKRARRMAEYFRQGKETLVKRWEDACYEIGIASGDDPDAAACYIYNRCMSGHEVEGWGWPLSNVWNGVTAENQERANERVPYMNTIEAAVKFVSVEPMLVPVDLSTALGDTLKYHAGGLKNCLSWVICGGESGHKARPLHPDWVRNLKNQCRIADVPFFFKQWGEWSTIYPQGRNLGNMAQTYEDDTSFYKVGRKAAGNVLDGKKWEEYPGEG